MGKAEEIVKELLIAEIKLRNELLIKHFGGVTFESVDKKVEQQQIGFEQPQSIVEFDLMEHAWKKGRKQADGTFAAGSLEKGWDFPKNLQGELNFKPETIERLQQSPLVIDRYEFSLSANGSFVNVKRVKPK